MTRSQAKRRCLDLKASIAQKLAESTSSDVYMKHQIDAAYDQREIEAICSEWPGLADELNESPREWAEDEDLIAEFDTPDDLNPFAFRTLH